MTATTATKATPKKRAAKPAKGYMLRTCNPDMTSFGGFRWPEKGEVSCPDWNPRPECGGGLHGLLDGEGDGALLSWAEDARWLVVEVDPSEVVVIGRKVKVPRGVVVFCGDRLDATAWLAGKRPGASIVGAATTAGYGGTATAGDRGTATAGDGGTATAGYRGTATAGDRGTATAGYRGTATAGDRGTATAGYGGTATAGDRGTATAGYGGTLVIRWWDTKRYRLVVGYVGEDGIKADTAYRCEGGSLVEVPS